MDSIGKVKITYAYALPDEFWQAMWERMVEDGTAETVFYDGIIADAWAFCTFISSPSTHPYVVKVDERVAALVWLTNLEGRSARGHFVVMKDFWHASRALGNEMLKTLLEYKYEDGEYCFDVITGPIPSWNSPAINVAIKAGFKQTGVIPNGAWNARKRKSFDMVMLAATREDI